MRVFENYSGNSSHTPSLLSLEFANTLSARGSNQPSDRLGQYSDLISWSSEMELIGGEQGKALLDFARQNPELADHTFQRAIILREAFYRMIEAAKENTPPLPTDLEILNRELTIAAHHFRLIYDTDHYEWEWKSNSDDLDQILWPIARSAVDILMSTALQRVGICEDDTCGWLFFDTSKNHSRRWCDMNDCGNRAKARRHYARLKVTTGGNPD